MISHQEALLFLLTYGLLLVIKSGSAQVLTGDCDFDLRSFCNWRNEKGLDHFDWLVKRRRTRSLRTGPKSDHSGLGMYIYIETSRPRKFLDTARLLGPWMRGPQCMTFYYHMYGSTMSCVVMYIRGQGSNKLKPVWLKSENRGNQWLRGQISINETGIYQVIIDGIRGSSYLGDAALDDFSFHRGICQHTGRTTYYVSSYKGQEFQITSQPSDHSQYSEELQFALESPRGNLNERSHFIYSRESGGHSFFTSKLDLHRSDLNFPMDVVVLSSEMDTQHEARKIYVIGMHRYGAMITLDDHRTVNCCRRDAIFSFYAFNVSESENRSISGCAPGWHNANKECFLFHLQYAATWSDARSFCHKLSAELAVVNKAMTMEVLANQRKQMLFSNRGLFLGLRGQLNWVWSDGTNVSKTYDLWGPKEPSGDGMCGSFLNAISWNSAWKGYGWRWNDQRCTKRQGYICEESLAVPHPLALFTLNGANGTLDKGPLGRTNATSRDITFATGPFGNLNGSFYFKGNNNSYVEIKTRGVIDARFSISVFAWVLFDNAIASGIVYKYEQSNYYGCLMKVFPSELAVEVRYSDGKRSGSYVLYQKNVLLADAWNFIGTTYDYHTGFATVFVNNGTVMQRSIPKMELETPERQETRLRHPFKGRISCLQVYGQALSVDQIMKIKTRCYQTKPIACRPNFFPLLGGCYLVKTRLRLRWKNALRHCNRKGGTLAKISREGLRFAFSNMLEKRRRRRRRRPKPNNLFIGLHTKNEWVSWIDGSPLNGSLWMPGYPADAHGIQSCALMAPGSSMIKNVNCLQMRYILCQRQYVNALTHRSLTLSSSVHWPGYPSLAIDRSYTTCFRSQKETNPWWQVTLEKPLHVESVEITDKLDCCPRDRGIIIVNVSSDQSSLNPTCTSSTEYGKTLELKVHCSPPARGRHVRMTLLGKNVTLVLCQVVIRTVDSPRDAHGVLREVWYNVNYNSKKAPTMLENPAFDPPPQSRIILRDFDAPVNVANNYIQRLTAYLQVPETGNYTFYLTCNDVCELWKHDVLERDIEEKKNDAEKSVAKQPIISLKRVTESHKWDRYKEQISQPMFLDKCRIYRMEAFMREETSNDHISAGMRRPNGEYDRPIPGTKLFWTQPGTRRIEVTHLHNKTSLTALVGSNLRISGFYRFCCDGVYCPDCPMELNISTLQQNVSVNSALNSSCVNTSFTASFETYQQPGNFTVKISFSFVDYSEQRVHERKIGHLSLQAVILKKCNFQSDHCDWRSPENKGDKWKLSTEKSLIKYPGNFVFIDGSYKAHIESSLLPWKPFHRAVGLCLRFSYLMPTQSKSTLKVYLKDPKEERQLIVWQLSGYHGTRWSAAQVAWSGAAAVQVIFEAEGFLDKQLNIAIDDVIITTENCSTRPYFAKPGFRCSDNQFRCANGECVRKNFLCDGDRACKDGSDEENCACPSSKFACQGEDCLLVTALCDGTKDCSEGDDEENCRNPCADHQCVDGSCITWSKTCSQTLFCRDGTNTPTACGSGKCRLNDLACSSKNQSSIKKRCRSFRGHCNFQNGRCGLKPEKNAAFHWTVGSGQTPTESTGPSYDHTSFRKDGSYIFIEASQRRPGEKARLRSGWIEPNETVCLQFWYHMHGADIGNLSVYLKTNQTESLVWRLSGDKGNRWRFGQTSLNSARFYEFVLEGTVGSGNKGDIAVDDLTVLDGTCDTILAQTSPDCHFEESMCDWEAGEGWVLDTFLEGLEKSGGFVSLSGGASRQSTNLSSPVINAHAYEWKCFRFWFYIGSDRSHVHVWNKVWLLAQLRGTTSNETMPLFFEDKITNEKRYMQIPLPSNYSNAKIDLVGYTPSIIGPFIAIDEISFTKEPCQRIPWKSDKDGAPCDITKNWCGWRSLRGWKRIRFIQRKQEGQDSDEAESDGDDSNGRGRGLIEPDNYEIHLPDVIVGNVSFSDISPLRHGFTLCFWLKTAFTGFFIEYKVASKESKSLVLEFYCSNNTFRVQLDKNRRVLPVGVVDDTWHHVCVTWVARDGLLDAYKDGERKFQFEGFWSSAVNMGIEGGGTMTIGFKAPNANVTVIKGKLSGFNLWNYPLKAEEILRMSHGCGAEAGNVKAWETVRKGLKKEVKVKWIRSCRDRKADRVVVDSNTTRLNETALLVSQQYNSSNDWHNKCLKFRYMIRGPGKKTLTVYQKTDDYRQVPIWSWKGNTGQNWIYGQVPLSAVATFQVVIRGEAEMEDDLVALTGLYVDEDPVIYCQHQPQSAKEACRENLSNMTGYFFSPFFPGYYYDDSFCKWNIKVPNRYIIRLTFLEFRLKDHPKCENCFLEIFDGGDETAPVIGRFCGYSYPPVFVSSSNHFTVVLHCHGKPPVARFKTFYHSIEVQDDQGASCSRQNGCPSSCKCEEFGEGRNKRILVTGEDLLTVPKDLPFNTIAVFFKKNRISQLREKDFANLTHLEYIDLSFNVLLRLERDSFQNVSSVQTLRLNSNFFRSLPAGGLTGLSNLRVLDLGKNLLRKVDGHMFDVLSRLEVLSLRSNQIRELEFGSFDKKSNLTHLYLQENRITTLPNGLFADLRKLKLLDLSSNELTTVSKGTFRGLKSLEYLYLDKNKLSEVPSDTFSELATLKFLKLDRFILCCYAKKSISGVDCDSPVDEFSSCDDLMKNKTLQICIWILGILAIAGNLLVIIWRLIDKEENRAQSFLLTNLAVADLFMGVYLLIIAIMDLRWQGEYFKHDVKWRSGLGCQLTGALSMLSSEVSVLILTIITLDRFICIVFPFQFRRLTLKSAVFSCTGVWIFGAVISLVPISRVPYFYDESGNFGFYSRSAVCLPLQLSAGRPAGWEYAAAFFVILNSISFMFILIAYITMFWTVKRVARAARSTNLNKESAMAKRLVFIVMTDFCCWMPIILINILSLTGKFYDPNKIAYVWIAVFVLPLNSSLNPILYTFSTERTKRSLNRKRTNVTDLVLKSLHTREQSRKQSPDWLKSSDGLTLVTNVISVPAAETRNQAHVQAKLRLIEEVDVLRADIEGKRLTGYALARCEEGNKLSMVLLKYFAKESKEDWTREVDIAQGLACSDELQTNLLQYRWHSKARDHTIEHGKKKIRDLYPNSLLICYEFVSSSTLEDFLCDKGTVLNFDAVCAISSDIISAIERLEDLGYLHNNITTNNILIGQCVRLPPIRAVLGGFSQVAKVDEPGAFTNLAVDKHDNRVSDIEQFGQLLATLLGHCHGSSEYTQLHEIMNLCCQETLEERPRASHIRELLEESWFTEGVWDTWL